MGLSEAHLVSSEAWTVLGHLGFATYPSAQPPSLIDPSGASATVRVGMAESANLARRAGSGGAAATRRPTLQTPAQGPQQRQVARSSSLARSVVRSACFPWAKQPEKP